MMAPFLTAPVSKSDIEIVALFASRSLTSVEVLARSRQYTPPPMLPTVGAG